MNVFVGPFLCFINNNPENWVGFIIEDTKVKSVVKMPYNRTDVSWEEKAPVDDTYYATDVNATQKNTQPFAIIIKNSNIYRVARQKRESDFFVNIVQRLQVNDHGFSWVMSPFHKAITQESLTFNIQTEQRYEPILVKMQNLAAIDVGEQLEEYKKTMPQYNLDTAEVTNTAVVNNVTVSPKRYLLEDAIKEISELQCFLFNEPRKKTNFLQVCFWQKAETWVMHCDLNFEKININLGDLASDTPLLNFLNIKKQKKTYACQAIHQDLAKERLLSYVGVRLWGLSIYQQNCIKVRIDIEDIWPIQSHLNAAESAEVLMEAWRSNGKVLCDNSISNFISPFQLLRLEQESRFYLASDTELSVAIQARLKHVFCYVNVLLMLAAKNLEIQKSLASRSIYPEIRDSVIGRAFSYELANHEWAEEVLSFVEKEIIWHYYSYETLVYFEQVFQSLDLNNPMYSELDDEIVYFLRKQLIDEDLLQDRYRKILPDIRPYIRVYEIAKSYTGDSAQLLDLQRLCISYSAFFIILSTIRVEFFIDIKDIINSSILKSQKEQPEVLLAIIEYLQNSRKAAELIQILPEQTIELLIEDYARLWQIRQHLRTENFELLLNRLENKLTLMPVNLDPYISLFTSIHNQPLKDIFITLTRLTLSQALEDLNEDLNHDALAKLRSLPKEDFISFILNLTDEDICNLLKYSQCHGVLNTIRQNELYFLRDLIKYIRPYCYEIFHNTHSFAQVLSELEANNSGIENFGFIVECHLQAQRSFWELFSLLPANLKLSIVSREVIKLKWLDSLEDIQKGLSLLEPQHRIQFLTQIGTKHIQSHIASPDDFLSLLRNITPSHHRAFLEILEEGYLLMLHQSLLQISHSCMQLSAEAADYLLSVFHNNNHSRHVLPSVLHHNLSEELELAIYRLWTRMHRYLMNFSANADELNTRPYSTFNSAHHYNSLVMLQNMLLFPAYMAHPAITVCNNQALQGLYTEIYNLHVRIYDHNYGTSFSRAF